MGDEKKEHRHQVVHLSNSDKAFIIAMAMITWAFIAGFGFYIIKLVVAGTGV